MTDKLKVFLSSAGVKKAYFCSGSRNSYLLPSFEGIETVFLFDERSAAFQALGYTKLSNEPVAICVTSGTALAECLPAVIEAYYSESKIIIISADRPKRLHGSHAPQTIKQENIFLDFTNSRFLGALESLELTPIKYPSHINIEIDDSKFTHLEEKVTELRADGLANFLYSKKNILLLITDGHKLTHDEMELIERLQVTVFLECTANIKLRRKCLRMDHTLVEFFKCQTVDLIIKIGRTPISKIWRLLDNTYTKTQVLTLNDTHTGVGRGHYYIDSPRGVFELLSNKQELSVSDDLIKLSACLKEFPESEASLYQNILNTVSNDAILYVGNSMPIRYVQLLSAGNHNIMASRGANGIDGQLSTAIGIANATSKEVHCILGDLTFLYDIGAYFSDLPLNLRIHIMNNKGGRIFERVKTPANMVNEHGIVITKLFKRVDVCLNEYFPNNTQTNLFWDRLLDQ